MSSALSRSDHSGRYSGLGKIIDNIPEIYAELLLFPSLALRVWKIYKMLKFSETFSIQGVPRYLS